MSARTRWAVVAAALAALAAPLPPAFVDAWYSRGLYPHLQHVLTPLSNTVPFALFDLLWVGAVALSVVAARRAILRHGWKHGALRCASGLALVAAVAYLVFLVTWGLNYRRVAMVDRVAFDPHRVTQAGVRTLAQRVIAEMNASYKEAHEHPETPDALAADFARATRSLGAPYGIVPARPKQTLLGGYFHETSVAGMTDPYFLETLVAPDLLRVERPFVIAHEWAHLAGYADEAEANYVAWLACTRGDAAARYSAALALASYVRPWDPRLLDLGPRTDLYAINKRYGQTSAVLQFAARRGYDVYLRANRVEAGVESYDLVVQLILGTRTDANGDPVLR